jgi:transcriptional regulator with XRE-family HTH domain
MSRNDALIQAFAAELKTQRSALGLSQEELAFRADVNRTYIAKLELAKNQPTLTVLYQVAAALESDLPDLLRATTLRYKRVQRGQRRGPQQSDAT